MSGELVYLATLYHVEQSIEETLRVFAEERGAIYLWLDDYRKRHPDRDWEQRPSTVGERWVSMDKKVELYVKAAVVYKHTRL